VSTADSMSTDIGWTDSHCHVTYDGVGRDALAAARAAGVDRVITIGTDAPSSAAGVEVARSEDGVWATVGLHPHEAQNALGGLLVLLEDPGPEVVAVGECGLDYFYEHSPRDVQRDVFAAQVSLAHERDLALVIHTRDAWDDTFEVLDVEGTPPRTVFHCFTGGVTEARRCLDLGAWLSFSGIVTFPKAPEVREAAAFCPLERMCVETDAPFLAPVPHRGKPNHPALVTVVGAAVAAVRDVDPAVIAAATSAAAAELFGLPAPGSPGPPSA